MLIICPSCMSAYRLKAESGSAVPQTARCAQCRQVFATAPARPNPPDLPDLRVWPDGPPVRAVHPLRSETRSLARAERSPVRVMATLLLCIGVVMAGVAFRDKIAGAVSPAAPWLGVPAVAGLHLQDVQTALADEGLTKVLTLEGRITNDRTTDAAVPDLRIVVRDDGTQSLYSWTTPSPRARLAPGEAVAFRSRLVSPPADGHDIVVSFADTVGDGKAIRVKGQP